MVRTRTSLHLQRRPGVLMRVDPIFKERVKSMREEFHSRFGMAMTEPKITRIITEHADWNSMFDVSEKGKGKLNKRKKHVGYGFGYGYLDNPDGLGLFK